MTVRRITNGDHQWTGEPVRRVCLCLPSNVRDQIAAIRTFKGILGRIFDTPSDLISLRFGTELLLTVYTGEGKGHTNDVAAMQGLKWTKSWWDRMQEEAEKAEAKKKGGAQ